MLFNTLNFNINQKFFAILLLGGILLKRSSNNKKKVEEIFVLGVFFHSERLQKKEGEKKKYNGQKRYRNNTKNANYGQNFVKSQEFPYFYAILL